jgi:hypothetical protein
MSNLAWRLRRRWLFFRRHAVIQFYRSEQAVVALFDPIQPKGNFITRGAKARELSQMVWQQFQAGEYGGRYERNVKIGIQP